MSCGLAADVDSVVGGSDATVVSSGLGGGVVGEPISAVDVLLGPVGSGAHVTMTEESVVESGVGTAANCLSPAGGGPADRNSARE